MGCSIGRSVEQCMHYQGGEMSNFLKSLRKLAKKAPIESRASAFTEQLALNVTDHLRTLRRERGVTRKELAKRCSLSVAEIRALETTTSMPSTESLVKYAMGMNVSLVLGIRDGATIHDVTPGRPSSELKSVGREYP